MDIKTPPTTTTTTIPLPRHPTLIIIPDTPKGRGIFTTTPIPAHTILETCPILLLGLEENEQHIRHTSLFHYTYNWPTTSPTGAPKTSQAVVFGLGSMFNHSRDQNVGWTRDIEKQIITYRTLRDIAAGEELCISYGDRLTFKDADNVEANEDEEDGIEHLNQIDWD